MSYLDKNGLIRYHDGIKTQLDNKTDIDGTYEELTAGYANNLKFTGYREDNTPYILRQSGGDVDPGYKSEKTIVGASIVMNQLVHNGDFGRTTWWGAENGDISVADNVLTYVCTASGSLLQNGIFADIDAEIDHVYFVTADIKTEKANTGQWFFLTGSAIVSEANTWTTISELKKATVTDTYFGIGLRVTTDVGETFQARNAFIIDITKMFGTNIANYVYGLETTTSGSGIAWLKQYFPAQFNSGYQAFSDGEIKSVSGLAEHKSVGFNVWDEVWEVGVYNNSGESVTNSFQIRSKNYIPVFSSTTYYLAASAGNRICFYDANKTFISVVFDKQNTTFVTPVNCKYIRFNMADAYGTTYNHDICINISKPTGTPKNGDYVPYDGHTYAFDSTKTLRGLYKLDSNNKLYADGDVYKADGTIQRRYGVVDLGTLTWSKNGNDGKFEILEQNCPSYKLPLNNTTKGNIFCGKYVTDTNENTYARVNDKTISVASTPYIRVYDSAYASSTGSEFKTAMSGVYLIYELATPTTETAEPYSSSQRVNPDGTEEFIFDSTTEVKLPVGHVTKYMDQAALLDEIITPPDKAGTYALRKTVSDGVTTYTWEDDVIPSISVSKADGVSTITVTDETGTNSVEIADGETPHLVLLSYGTSTWTDFINAYTTNSLVYCRASSNSNPASGSKTRLAFMAYVNNETNPTNVEFQYYRSVNQHSATQQGDQMYVYKLDKTAGWTVTVRESYTRVVAGTKMSSTWSNGILTMNFNGNDLPSGGTTGQVLKKTSGTDYAVEWADVIPPMPSTDGRYHLEVSVENGVPTMSWVANT